MNNSVKNASKVKSRSLRVLGILGVTLGLVPLGCNSSENSNTKFASASVTGKISTQQIIAQVKQLHSPENKDLLAQASKMTMRDYFAKIYAETTNEPFQIDGYTFSNMHDQMKIQEADLQAISDRYATLGDYMSAFGVASLADVPPETIETALVMLDKIYNQGMLAKVQQAKNQHTNTLSGLTLTSDLGCAGSAIGMGAAAATTVGVCAATLGLGCAFAVAGTVGASMSMGNSCDGLSDIHGTMEYNPYTQPKPVPQKVDDPAFAPQACSANSINPNCKG